MLEILQTYGVFFLVGQYPKGPLGGLALTLLLAASALVLALPVGLALALCRRWRCAASARFACCAGRPRCWSTWCAARRC